MIVRSIVMAILCVFFSSPVSTFADDQMSLTVEGVSTDPSPIKAKQAALKDALEKASIQQITILIGQAKLDKNRSAIMNKIVSQSEKFITYYKALEPIQSATEFRLPVSLRLNMKNLKDFLAQEGLLYQSEGPATVLPLIQIYERKEMGKSFRWWIEEASSQNQSMRDLLKQGFGQFDQAFRAKSFYFMDPITSHYTQMVPDAYRNSNLGLEDLLWLGQFFKAQMVLTGEVVFGDSPTKTRVVQMDVRLTAYHVANGRVVGEISRTFESLPSEWEAGETQIAKKGFDETVKDLTSQIFEEWARGAFSAQLLKVKVSGNIDYKDLEAFKKQMTQTVADIKTLRERRFESGDVVFEADVAGGIGQLAKRIESTAFTGYTATVSSIENNVLDLRWKRR